MYFSFGMHTPALSMWPRVTDFTSIRMKARLNLAPMAAGALQKCF